MADPVLRLGLRGSLAARGSSAHERRRLQEEMSRQQVEGSERVVWAWRMRQTSHEERKEELELERRRRNPRMSREDE